MSANTITETIAEAQRQVIVCNACRYCEGFCSVFPAVHRQRDFSDGDLTQLANLCHNCRGCYYACQYTEPHEFAINLPRALADLRTQSWQHHLWPAGFTKLFQTSGLKLAIATIIGISLLFWFALSLPRGDGAGFYAYLSHTLLVGIFAPAFILPLCVIAVGLKRYWTTVRGDPIHMHHIVAAFRSAATMKNLDGGQGQGCNYEATDRYTNHRRIAHQLTMYGFLLCFASTSVATLLHYAFNIQAPYSFFSIPKLLGLPGGLLLVIGSIWLVYLKLQADVKPGGTNVQGAEMAFIVLLGATGGTGLLLYIATDTTWVRPLLAIHLGTVLTFFLTMPYTKMVHGFFRLAALTREAQQAEAQQD